MAPDVLVLAFCLIGSLRGHRQPGWTSFESAPAGGSGLEHRETLP